MKDKGTSRELNWYFINIPDTNWREKPTGGMMEGERERAKDGRRRTKRRRDSGSRAPLTDGL